jgi:methylglutaconyl-CoA hydratase
MYKTIELDKGTVTTVWLNRPEVKNAFNKAMVDELIQAFTDITNEATVKVVVIRAKGPVFCSGADLQWMKQSINLSNNENFEECLHLAECFRVLYSLPQTVVCIAKGAVMGGGNGLIAASDISVCTNTTSFAFSEVKLGIVPAVISPYVVRRIGEAKAKELMLTARMFTGEYAASIDLVSISVDDENKLEQELQEIIKQLLANNSNALRKTKEMISQLYSLSDLDRVKHYTAELLALARVSSDGQEGMAAFLEKRKPNWN